MKSKDTFCLGMLFFIVAFYLDFHPFWLTVFTLVSLVGLFGMMKRVNECPSEMADINPF